MFMIKYYNMSSVYASPLEGLPSFPTFTPIRAAMKETIERYTHKFPRYSDYNFFSMLTYDVFNSLQISVLNNNLVVIFRDYISLKPFYSFIGVSQVLETTHILLNESAKNGYGDALKLVPQTTIDQLPPDNRNKLTVTEDPDNNDYIYSLKDYVNLSGKEYRSHREKIHRFKKKYPDIDIRRVDLASIGKDALELFSLWKSNKIKSGNKVDGIEREAFRRAVEYAKLFNLITIGVYDKEKLIAISVVDVTNNYPTGAFIKADTSYGEIFRFTQHAKAEVLLKNGFIEMNCEQDLGIQNLRESKESWHPIKYLKKYIVGEA
ncbi:MAG: hypothetical protein UW82_C0015G0013 [candidate division WWE3 bacterium GW2011_GWC2_44_9]|nr:MAG: hypothetical protein UW82_C0015G0013 [candidate division WWE3 bacterium GW2011_GWC2_44_9]